MVKGIFICAKSYDFTDNSGNRVVGANAHIFIPDQKDCVKAQIKGNAQYYSQLNFGDEVDCDVEVNGRYAKYVLN